jgi:hypothetical protein
VIHKNMAGTLPSLALTVVGAQEPCDLGVGNAADTGITGALLAFQKSAQVR